MSIRGMTQGVFSMGRRAIHTGKSPEKMHATLKKVWDQFRQFSECEAKALQYGSKNALEVAFGLKKRLGIK